MLRENIDLAECKVLNNHPEIWRGFEIGGSCEGVWHLTEMKKRKGGREVTMKSEGRWRGDDGWRRGDNGREEYSGGGAEEAQSGGKN
ncbi:hypothetical protein Droror1_Dr00012123 [Drosera rotundifolia]